MMISNLSESLAKPLVMAKLNMAYLSSLKTEQNCCCHHCRCHHLGYSVPPAHHRTIWCRSTFVIQKIEIFLGSRISKFLRPAQRYDDFKLIRITCQAACHGKTEHGIFVKFKKPSKTAVVIIAGVTISGTPCPRHIIVPFGAEAPSLYKKSKFF